MDVQMPEMDGYEATSETDAAKANQNGGHHTPIIAMTANAMQEIEKALEAGMDEYFSGP